MSGKLKDSWRFIDTAVNNGFLNMAIDEAILDIHLQGISPPTLRVYRWSPTALTIGYFQNLEREIETKKCSDLGIDIVRRLSGGRAVLHNDELTYSVVVSEEYGAPKSLETSYRLLSSALIAAYRILGLDICLDTHGGEPASAACFSSTGLADLAFQGRKLCGSAQFRRGNALLQHGSLPISLDAGLLFSVLKYPSTALRDRAQAKFCRQAAGINDISGNDISREEIKEALFRGFQTSLGIKLYEDTLMPEEVALSQKLAEEKYKSIDWNYHGKHETSLVN